MKHQTHFDQAWQLLLEGHDLHSILARFPDEKDELEPLLQAALRLRAVQNLTASTSFRQTTRIRLLNSIQASPAPTPRPHRRSYFNFQLPWLLGRSSWVGALLALVVLLSGMTATTVAAQAALPGDILYPVKRTSEEIQRLLASDPLTQNLILSERRLAEVQALQAQARYKNIPQALSLYRQELEQMAKLMSATTMPGDSIPQLQQQVQQLHNLDQVLPDAQQALIAESLVQATDILHQAQSSDSSHPEPEQSQEPVITLTPTAMPDMGGPHPSATPDMEGPHPSATPDMGGPQP
ncbi:MAG: hypothetical protein GXP37_15480, partial [Chloroflexi bacterium]|nr:hypothetical protein [Chloroflexota bacterium]